MSTKMTTENKAKALKILTSNNAIKISFNVPLTDNYSNVHEILIHECNAAVINTLVAEGFSLYMTNKGLSVTKF